MGAWQDLLASSGAQTFFKEFPNDEELVRKLEEVFGSGKAPSLLEVRRDRERFYGRPARGEAIRELPASPTKNAILNKALQINLYEAFAEIIDNIFDNYIRNTGTSLKIEIVAYREARTAPAEILIKENSGGLEASRVLPLIQLGLSEPSAKGIGAWGEGFKMAVFALAEEVEVFSTYPGEDPICIFFPRGWLQRGHHLWNQWKVGTFGIQRNAPDDGTTLIRLAHLRKEMLGALGFLPDSEHESEEVCERIVNYFGEVYAEKYHLLRAAGKGDIAIEFRIGEAAGVVRFKERAEERLRSHLAFLPWLKPIKWTLTWETEVSDPGEEGGTRKAVLSAEILAGLGGEFGYSDLYDDQKPGVEMWGNGRLFTLKGRISDDSVGWGYRFGGRGGTNPRATASARRLMMVVLFSADDSRDIPWAAPLKTDYNRRSEFYAEIRRALANVIRLYKDGVNLLEARLVPFTREWSRLDEREKLRVIFEGSGASEDFKESFAKSRFGRKVLDYSADDRFYELEGVEAPVTLSAVNVVSSSMVRDCVTAAAETKGSAKEIVEFLKAIFPRLAQEAVLEEELGLEG